MSVTNPAALWLLALLPLVAVLGWPRLAYRRLRDGLSLAIRLLIVLLLVLALAGLQRHRLADKLAVVFLLDVSDSVSPAQQSAAVEYVRRAAEAMGDQDQAAVIVFGADAQVEVPITDRLELVQIGANPGRRNTNLAEAMRVGLALFPADTAKRMVILSDGVQTLGDAEQVARLAAASQVQIDHVALAPLEVLQGAGPEVLVAAVDVPALVNQGERFSLTITLATNRVDSNVEVRVLSRGRIIEQRELMLQPGLTNTVFEVTAAQPGFVDFDVVVEPRGADTFYQNNHLAAFTEVIGAPRVLLVTSDRREIASLRAVLAASGLQVDVQGPRDLPIGLAPLSSYDSVILANVSATELTADRMAYLQAYVRDLGRGLVVIGGPDSFGVGGYFETALEETLPVEMRLRDQRRVPQLTMLFVLDRSGSMELSSSGGVSNLELAKEAVVRSFDLLNDNDRTGVVSFDVSAYYVVELQPVGDEVNRRRLRDLVGSLRPGGGTNIRQAVLSADQLLRNDPSELKHIILLTDGGADPGGIALAVDRMYQNYGITTSVVAVGQDYARWLEEVARAGRGQFHLALDVSTIPAIFTAETLLATRAYIQEEPFVPTVSVPSHPILGDLNSTPPLQGYVATSAKELATVILRGPQGDPILAAWQYGLGRAVAFTSDASSRWAADWIGWEGYDDFWNQAVRWTMARGGTANVETTVRERGQEAVVSVAARDRQGGFLNGLVLQAAIVNSDLTTTVIPLQQVAPGQYEGTFTPTAEGAYFVTVAGSTAETDETLTPQTVMQTAGWVLGYSPEYALRDVGASGKRGEALLQSLSQLTGGRSLADQPAAAFAHNLRQERAAQPLWPYLVGAALWLLPVDVGVRRLVVTRGDLARLADWLRLRRTEPFVESRPEHMDRLLGAKERARRQRVGENVSPPQPGEHPPAPSERPSRRIPRVLAEPPEPQETLAARLLQRKRIERNQQDRDETDT